MVISNIVTRIQNNYRRRVSVLRGRRMVDLRPKFPIISFTFDDFPKSALHQGGAILRKYGAGGTYYVSLGLMDREIPAGRAFSIEDIKRVLDEGHELGCHTFAHCHSWETKPSLFEESIVENKHALKEIVPGADFKTLSYPIAYPRPQTKRRAAKHFICCRGGGETFNAGPTDANHLRACFLEKSRNNPEAVKRLINENCRGQGWLIFATHDICDAPTPFGCTPEFFEDIVRCAVSSSARILPVAKAWEALQVVQ